MFPFPLWMSNTGGMRNRLTSSSDKDLLVDSEISEQAKRTLPICIIAYEIELVPEVDVVQADVPLVNRDLCTTEAFAVRPSMMTH